MTHTPVSAAAMALAVAVLTAQGVSAQTQPATPGRAVQCGVRAHADAILFQVDANGPTARVLRAAREADDRQARAGDVTHHRAVHTSPLNVPGTHAPVTQTTTPQRHQARHQHSIAFGSPATTSAPTVNLANLANAGGCRLRLP